MKKQSTVIVSMLILLVAAVLQVSAAETKLKKYTDQALGFSIQYPDGWQVQKDEANKSRVYFASKESDTVVAMTVNHVEQKMSAKDFLKALEQKMGVKNLMDEKDRAFDAETCETMNVHDGYCGSYIMKQDGKDVYSIMNAFTRENTIYFLMLSSTDKEELDWLEDILPGFRAL